MAILVRRARHASFPVALLAAGLVIGGCAAGVTSSSVAPAAPGASAVTVGAATVGGLGPLLTGTGGRTLYVLTRDHPGTTTCTGTCATVWPPFTVGPGESAVAGTGVTGTLATITRPDGSRQVTYDGMPLYYYSGDTQAGQANGQGIQGIWYVALAAGSGAAPGSAAPPSAAPSASGYSGY